MKQLANWHPHMHTKKFIHFLRGKGNPGEGRGGEDLEGKTWQIGNAQIHTRKPIHPTCMQMCPHNIHKPTHQHSCSPRSHIHIYIHVFACLPWHTNPKAHPCSCTPNPHTTSTSMPCVLATTQHKIKENDSFLDD